MPAPRLLAFAGSTREGSFNKRLVAVAAAAAREAGAEVTLVDLADHPLPLFDEDLERAGPSEETKAWKALFAAHDGFLISTPEYNSSYPAVLKNHIDWASRPAKGEASLAAFAGKTAALLSATPGALGGIRVLPQLRLLLSNIRVLVVPEQFGLARAGEAFDGDGGMKDPKQRESVESVARALVRVTAALVGAR